MSILKNRGGLKGIHLLVNRTRPHYADAGSDYGCGPTEVLREKVVFLFVRAQSKTRGSTRKRKKQGMDECERAMEGDIDTLGLFASHIKELFEGTAGEELKKE